MFLIVAAPWGPNHLQSGAHQALPVTDKPDDSDKTLQSSLFALRRLKQQTLMTSASRLRHDRKETAHLDGLGTWRRQAHHADRGRELSPLVPAGINKTRLCRGRSAVFGKEQAVDQSEAPQVNKPFIPVSKQAIYVPLKRRLSAR